LSVEYKAIVVGGGIMGTSLLCHLTQEGWSDCLLLEKGEFDLRCGRHGYEPIWSGERRVGYITSGGYGQPIGKSLAMALVERDL